MPTIDPAARLRGSQKGAQVAAKLRRERAEADLLEDGLWEEIVISRAEGSSFQAIADELNADGELAPRGGPWHATQVQRVLRRVLTMADELIDDYQLVADSLRRLSQPEALNMADRDKMVEQSGKSARILELSRVSEQQQAVKGEPGLLEHPAAEQMEHQQTVAD
jgi:hypothetical protein